MKCESCAEYGSEFCNLCEDRLNEARKPQPPRWKRGKYPGEIEATIGGKKYKIEKALDHNDRHKGEWKVMVWDRGDWEWETTEYGKSNAKAWIMNKHGIKESVEPHPEVVKAYKKTLDAEDQAGDYNYRSNKARVTRAANHLSKKIKQHHPDLDMKSKIALRTKLQNMKEEAMTAADAGIPQDTKNMGPRLPKHILRRRLGVPINMTDRRRKKDKVPVILKRFRKYMDG